MLVAADAAQASGRLLQLLRMHATDCSTGLPAFYPMTDLRVPRRVWTCVATRCAPRDRCLTQLVIGLILPMVTMRHCIYSCAMTMPTLTGTGKIDAISSEAELSLRSLRPFVMPLSALGSSAGQSLHHKSFVLSSLDDLRAEAHTPVRLCASR